MSGLSCAKICLQPLHFLNRSRPEWKSDASSVYLSWYNKVMYVLYSVLIIASGQNCLNSISSLSYFRDNIFRFLFLFLEINLKGWQMSKVYLWVMKKRHKYLLRFAFCKLATAWKRISIECLIQFKKTFLGFCQSPLINTLIVCDSLIRPLENNTW